MKVIGAGLGRTGTLSTKVALDMLGLPSSHGGSLRPSRSCRWCDVIGGGNPDWAEVFCGYQATVDWPSTSYWRELIKVYPDAKVLLNTRDPQRWYDSMLKTIFASMSDDHSTPTEGAERLSFNPRLIPHLRKMQGAFFATNDRLPTRDEAIAVYQRHVAEVQRTVEPERLLIFEVKHGWEPLCEFLELDVPDQPFPKINDSANFRNDVAEHTRLSGAGPLR